jgi:hypothetical protein
VIALHQAGFENAVSPMGTALTEDQLRLLKRFTRKIVLALKGSPATAPTPRVQFAPPVAPEPTRPAGAKDEWAEETTDKAKVMTAFGKGAAAVLLYNPDPAPAAAEERSRPNSSKTSRPTIPVQTTLAPTRAFLSRTRLWRAGV